MVIIDLMVKDMSKEKISKNMTMGEVVHKYPETVAIMMKHGLHCVGCHLAAMETIEQGAIGHGVDVDKLLKDMNRAIEKNKKSGNK